MKTLVIIAHPNITTSVMNKRWLEELKKYPEKYTIHELYKVYPNGAIDVEKEQKMVESHGQLIFQFPIHWFNCPPLLKKWLDDVLTYGWAYGSNGGDKLKNRKIALGVTAGIKKENYTINGRYTYTLEQILVPFKTTFLYCSADYRSHFACYGKENAPGGNEEEENDFSTSEMEKSTQDYLNFIESM
ncbi:NAD(P)H-dependent oxidoreductase [Bacillus pumilus]|uniref:NAD(P)H-dependent oxidoreductase n=1 Tax=Bacillus pumilus TaxID=1408 RepID=UPI002282B6F4|nr:NAD(P)H-dependent oxidoreductase [Bacillus pumilus]MCY9671595.1 NAD(P)H-dependent oxidoreductase [Bacillus pumilus]